MTQRTVFISANTAWNLLGRKRLIVAMQQAGWNVVCMAAPDSNDERLRTELNVEFIPLPMKGDGTNLRADVGLFFRYLNLYRTRKPAAALHINNKPNIYGSIAASILRIPSASNITGLGVVAEKKGLMKNLVYSLYRIAFASKRTFVFFQNKEDREFFIGNHLVALARTAILPGSGVNCSLFVPSPRPDSDSSIPKKGLTFLFNGRLVITKGIRVFIDAASEIRCLYPETQFAIIGEYDSSNSIFLSQAELDTAVTSGTVMYYGSVPDVKPYVQSADCVVLPSWYREGVPRALLEAAAMGKPLIACDSVGTRDPVQDGINGYLVAPNDKKNLASAMERFIKSSEDERNRMGRESRNIAETKFNDTIVIEAYLKYLAVIS